MENKCIKTSNLQQLQVLVEYMEANSEFARRTYGFMSRKRSMEEQWKNITKKLNSMGPPVLTIAEWKKTWTDLMSNTKNKIADNNKSLRLGGGPYQVNPLSELEQIVDRTVFLSTAAAPSGKAFGIMSTASSETIDRKESCFTPLADAPATSSKIIAIVTPLMRNQEIMQPSQQLDDRSPQVEQRTNRLHGAIDEDDFPSSSSSRKRRATDYDYISLIRRQIRVTGHSAAVAKEHSNATKMLAEAAEALADAAKKIADAAEIQAEAARKCIEINKEVMIALQAIEMLPEQSLNSSSEEYTLDSE